MRFVSFLLSLSLLGCFPHSARHRTYAKGGEGASLAAGIAMLAIVNSGADCMPVQGDHAGVQDCKNTSTIVGDVGFGLILAGLLGFVVTVSTTPDETPRPALPTAAKDPLPTPKLPGARPTALR